jgi:hypothetical protein
MTAARRFQYVPFGVAGPAGALACDGLVEGETVHLSHWGGNHTPPEFKADTSVEIALRYAEQGARDAGPVVNNHFDTDGVLAVWALMEPDLALSHRGLIVAAAEAGDFEEWPADERGLWLDAAVRALGARAGGDARAYGALLPALGGLVAHIADRSELWRDAWEALLADRARATQGAIEVSRVERIAVLHHRAGVSELPGAVLTRAAPPGCTRWLLVLEQDDGGFHYRYERPRWCWADTVVRPVIEAPSRNAVARELGPHWALKGELGMTGLVRTARPVRAAPREVTAALLANDPGARS